MKNQSAYFCVLIAALGYFVDIYDLALFSIVRVESLIDLGYSGATLQEQSIFILNMQMLGMLIGGILWGILGDKRGRTSVLFGSILLYSLANIFNGYVEDVNSYAWIRFFAGIGLAGELGVGVTLVIESLPQKYRGYGTLLITAAGAFGTVVGFYVADLTNWRVAYFIGGGMGLVLLVLRFKLLDSPLFIKMREMAHSSGNFFMLFKTKELFLRYVKCILLGAPLWAVMGVVATFSPEIAVSMSISDQISSGRCIMLANAGLALGDVSSGLLSQVLKSRKKALARFIILAIITTIILLSGSEYSASNYYWGIFFLGFGAGMWVLCITTSAEQFGTDIRATAATSIPNFVRAMAIPLIFCFQALQAYFAIQYAALIVTCTTFIMAFLVLFGLKETFQRNLDFYENKK